MRTVIIKVGPLLQKAYPVELFYDDNTNDWFQRPLATSSIPEELTLAQPITDPIDGKVLDKERVEKFFSAENESNIDRFRAIGKYLYQLLFEGDVKLAWEKKREEFPREQKPCEGLRTILDIEPPELQSLPWELIRSKHVSLFRDPSNPIVRGKIKFDDKVHQHMWPLRALVVVGSKETDHIHAEEEVESISSALRNVGRTIEIDVLRHPSKDELVGKYKAFEPHIFHFIGHGGFMFAANRKTKDWCLYIYDKAGKQWEWTAEEITDDLRGTTWASSFAFINACRSGDPMIPEGSWGIAEAFREAGVPSVLSMMGDVKDSAAQIFTEHIYAALAENRSLDSALAEARHAISIKKDTDLKTRQWALASLFISVPPEKILPVKPQVSRDLFRRIESDSEFSKQKTFVDRLDLRLSISDRIDPRKENADYASLLIVRGDGEVGKTAMLKLWLECCALRGRKFSWVPLDGGERTKTFLDVLRLIRDGVSDYKSLLNKPLSKRAFNQFNWELPSLLKSKVPLDVSKMPSGIIEEGAATREIRVWNGDPNSRSHLFLNFRRALKKAAGKGPLIIVLDQLEILPEDFNNVLIPELLLPIQQHEVGPVRMILVASSARKDEKRYDLQKLGYCARISVPRFSKDDYMQLAFEFLLYHDYKRSKVASAVKAVAEQINGDWTPGDLKLALEIFRARN